MLVRAKEVTRQGRQVRVEYARFADNLVVLVDAHPRQAWLRKAVEKRLREELAKLQVEVNKEKSRRVVLDAMGRWSGLPTPHPQVPASGYGSPRS
jgi:RNA-directed DNA polymerase